MSDVGIIILSHKRAGRVTTHRCIEHAKVCIPESQVWAYKVHHHGKTIIAHPDSVIGLPAKRDWCIRNLGSILMLDDDSLGMVRLYRHKGLQSGEWRKGNVSPGRAYDVVQMVADTARQVGAFLWGFNNHPSPMCFIEHRPFRFGGYNPGGSIGVHTGSKLWWPQTTLPVDDYWVCLLNAHLHRKAWYDLRFAWGFKDTYVGAGGMAEYRIGGKEKDATTFLLEHFGNQVVVRKVIANGATRQNKNRWSRRIAMPYRI